tara:strand:+ start:1017 stop:1268 length:252 start_codon:yes stop_codon:yes gene_type:complete
MNKFEEAYNKHMEKVYVSMCLNEYTDDDDSDQEDPALAAADDAAEDSDVAREKEKHDKELEKVISQKTQNLKKTSSALKRSPV